MILIVYLVKFMVSLIMKLNLNYIHKNEKIVIDEKLYKILIQPSINFNFYQVSSQCKKFCENVREKWFTQEITNRN